MSEDTNVDTVVVEPSASEVEARKFGWVPQEEFAGPPEKWRDAETFLERGKEINGFLRKDLNKLADYNKKLEVELSELKQTMKEFAAFHQETEKRAYERAQRELREAKKQAIAEGDGERVIEIEEQQEKLKAIDPDKKAPKVSETPVEIRPALQAQFDEWRTKNTWYGTDEDLSIYADAVGTKLRQTNPELIGADYLAAVEQKVKATFPQKFQRRQANVDGGGESGASASSKSKAGKRYQDLPPEAKKACDKFVRDKLLTQEEYVKQYFEE